MTPADPEILFRAMTSNQNREPELDASSRTLGGRPWLDIPGDATDYIGPGVGSMSVAIATPMRLPTYRRPVAFGGSGGDPVFAIAVSALGPDLRLREDPDVPSGHGFVEPVHR